MGRRGERCVKRRQSFTGYRLHSERLALTSAQQGITVSGTRTIKFPLVSDHEQLKRAVAAVRSDYIALHGPISYHDWALTKATPVYSLIDFWIDAISLGGIFCAKNEQLYHVAALLTGNDPVAAFRSHYQGVAPAAIQAVVDWAGACEFFSSDIRSKPRKCFVKEAESEELVNQLLSEYTQAEQEMQGSKAYQKAENKKELLRDLRAQMLLRVGPTQSTVAIAPEGDATSADNNHALNLTFLFIPSAVLTSRSKTVAADDCAAPWQLENASKSYVENVGRTAALEKVVAFVTQLSQLTNGTRTPAELLGLTEHYNGFSNFFNRVLTKLKQNHSDVAAAMLERFPKHLHSEIREEIGLKCKMLGDLAKKLGEPKIASTWAAYRSFLGGEIQSWYSNRDNLLENLQKDLKKKLGALKELDILLANEKFQPLLDRPGNKLLSTLVRETKECIAPLAEVESTEVVTEEIAARYSLLEGLFAELNTALNEFHQAHNLFQPSTQASARTRRGSTRKPKQMAEGESKDSPLQKKLAKRMQRLPAFFGETKRREYPKFLHAPRLLTWFIETLQFAFSNSSAPNLELTNEDVEKLLHWVADSAEYGSQEEKILRADTCPLRILLPLRKYPRARRPFCYKSSFSRQQRAPAINAAEFQEWLRTNSSLSTQNVVSWFLDVSRETFLKVKSGHHNLLPFLRALIKLWPTIIKLQGAPVSAVTSRLIPRLREFFSEDTHKNMHRESFPRLWGYLDSFIFKAPSVAIDEILAERVQAKVFAECTGLASLVSYASFIARYSVQEQKGAQMNLLVAKKEGEANERFAVDLIGIEAPKPNDGNPQWRLMMKAQSLIPELPTYEQKGSVFAVQSSKYQLQFLRKSLKSVEAGKCRIEPSGSFLIAESDVRVHPDWQTGEMAIVQEHSSPPRLYASIPFRLETEAAGMPAPALQPLSESAEAEKGRVIGIDIGEYALTYSVVDWEKRDGKVRFSFVDTQDRVMSEGAHRVLKDEVKRLKKRQVRGTFSASSSAVANLRETLVGAYRAKLHDLVVRYRAPLVFESSVSAFEAGGSRIKKIYDSLKISDTGGDSDADKNVMKHYWGDKRRFGKKAWESGRQISAPYTSQLCTCCRRAALQQLSVVERDSQSDFTEPRKCLDERGRYKWHEVEIGGLHLRAFLSRQQSLKSPKDVRQFVKAAMRPPLKRFKRMLPEAAKKRRGNSSIFWCPFLDCGHVSDCDVQASFVIAVKSVVKQLFKAEYEAGQWLEIVQDSNRIVFDKVDLDRRYFRNPYAPGERLGEQDVR